MLVVTTVQPESSKAASRHIASTEELTNEKESIEQLDPYSKTNDWFVSMTQIFTNEYFIEVFRIFPAEYKLYVWPWGNDNPKPFI